MAAATFAERIAIDLRLRVPAQRMVALTRGSDGGTTEYTARTAAVSEDAAAMWESRMGDAGAFDDTDSTIGNQTAKQWGARFAKYLLASYYQLDMPENDDQTERRLMDELERHAETARQEAATPVVYDIDGEVVT